MKYEVTLTLNGNKEEINKLLEKILKFYEAEIEVEMWNNDNNLHTGCYAKRIVHFDR
jgi:uncharacterized protein (DUF305 family)